MLAPQSMIAAVFVAAMFASPTLALGESKAVGGASSGEVLLLGTPTMIDEAPTLVDDLQTLPTEDMPVASETDASAPHDPAVTHCVRELGEDGKTAARDTLSADGAGTDGCVQMVDAVPTMVSPDGSIIPLGQTEGSTAALVEQRLQERRFQIEAREDELDAKQAILDAAERRIEQLGAALDSLQRQVEASQASVTEAAAQRVKDMISVYEGMKPASAAQIFDALPDSTLVTLATEMDPRKLAPILAKMNAKKASALTALLGGREK